MLRLWGVTSEEGSGDYGSLNGTYGWNERQDPNDSRRMNRWIQHGVVRQNPSVAFGLGENGSNPLACVAGDTRIEPLTEVAGRAGSGASRGRRAVFSGLERRRGKPDRG
jgi:hypothetical protein